MIKIADFFCGIGGIRLGFETASDSYKCVFSNDIDKKAIQTYEKNWSEEKVNNTSIADLKVEDIPDFNIFLGGFPCQSFSIAGNRKGLDDYRGNLFFEIVRILDKKRPEAFMLENVRNLKSHNNGETYSTIKKSLLKLGYFFKCKIMNSCEYGNIPQNRERLYMVGFLDKEKALAFKFPKKIKLEVCISDILEEEKCIKDKYYYKEGCKIYEKLKEGVTKEGVVYQYRRQYVRENKSGVCPTLTANMGGGGHNVPIIVREGEIRKLTPRECFRLQGFPDWYKMGDMADSHLYKQIGNSVTVSVVRRIAEGMYRVLV